MRGGDGRIRTSGALSDTPVFKTGAFVHSATSPLRIQLKGFSAKLYLTAFKPTNLVINYRHG